MNNDKKIKSKKKIINCTDQNNITTLYLKPVLIHPVYISTLRSQKLTT